MIKLNRTTEYGLMALRHMNRKKQTPSTQGDVTSAREISDTYGFPFEITAKTLQRLKDTGLIQSAQGARGGYTLQRALDQVNLAEFLSLMEGPQLVVACASSSEAPKTANCEYHSKCEMRGVMSDLNSRIYEFLTGIRLSELAEGTLSAVPFESEASLDAAIQRVSLSAVQSQESSLVSNERVNP